MAGTPRLQGRLACIAAGAALLCAAPPALAAPGAAGSGDSVFPHLGNGGYDATHYDVHLDYQPKRRTISGSVAMTAESTQDLSSFTLDMRRWLKVRSVALDGVPVQHRQRKAKLAVFPAASIADGASFTVTIRYRGRPRPAKGGVGWIPTDDGGLVAAEPDGASTWIPCNMTLTDKATYALTFTVPKPLKAISNGRLLGVTAHGRKRTWSWAESQPMAAYLATVGIGRFRVFRSQVAGLPSIVAIDPREGRRVPRSVKRAAEMLALFSERFGAYPFDSVGAIIDHFGGFVGLETQTRPVYNFAPKAGIHAHELAHQWFGDSMGFGRWQDIWLAEGFAQWSMWLWWEHSGVATVDEIFENAYSLPNDFGFFWRPAPGAIRNPRKLFTISVYDRGAMTVEALRRELGDPVFYALIKDWLAQRQYGNGTVPDFIALAEQHAGRDLDALFNAWLYRPKKPTGPAAHARHQAAALPAGLRRSGGSYVERPSTSRRSRTASSAAQAGAPPYEPPRPADPAPASRRAESPPYG